jgi:hypothetical protein
VFPALSKAPLTMDTRSGAHPFTPVNDPLMTTLPPGITVVGLAVPAPAGDPTTMTAPSARASMAAARLRRDMREG